MGQMSGVANPSRKAEKKREMTVYWVSCLLCRGVGKERKVNAIAPCERICQRGNGSRFQPPFSLFLKILQLFSYGSYLTSLLSFLPTNKKRKTGKSDRAMSHTSK